MRNTRRTKEWNIYIGFEEVPEYYKEGEEMPAILKL